MIPESSILQELINGNSVYTSRIDKILLQTLAEKGQTPKAAVISCSDSRVPVELIFDAVNPGTFYVIRVAGNIISGPVVVGSIEFAVLQLKIPYVILLGHSDCRAVKASVERSYDSEMMTQMLKLIKPRNRDLNKAVIENLGQQFKNMLEIGCVQKGIRDGVLEAYSMIYDLQTGKVNTHDKAGNIQER